MPSIADLVAARLRDVPDFPQPGVVFKDFTPVFADPEAFGGLVRYMAERWRGTVSSVAGIEARGFIIGAALAYELGIAFVPIRKVGKLPGDTVTASYDLEYGSATIEVSADAFGEGDRVLIVDDVLATGGTAAAACDLVEKAGGTVVAVDVVLELGFLGGRSLLGGRDVHSLIAT